jgi:hypothetical protein
MVRSPHNGTFYSVEDLELAEPEAIYSVDERGRKKSLTVDVANSMNGLDMNGFYDQSREILPPLPTSRFNALQGTSSTKPKITTRKEVGFR